MTTTISTNPYTVTLDDGQSLAQRIAAGGYDHVNRHINEANWPVQRGEPAERELILVHVGHVASTGAVQRALDELGLRSGRIEDLLAFGTTYPEAQRQFPIVAIGAIAKSYWRRPFLWGSQRVRHLDLRFDEKIWSGNIRFLTVRR